MVTRGPRRWPRRLTQVVLGLAAVALAIGGVVAVGNVAREAIQPSERYHVPFSGIECPAPPGQAHAEFLEEVRYLGKFPTRVNILDPKLPDHLRTAFAAHRRVAEVTNIRIQSPKKIEVELRFRP
ncbi:MAG TPA: hypothetical protein VHR66_13675 [Gemmataceae bacterium]|nr:hypothetical protein [Gemmataceae bacterium]